MKDKLVLLRSFSNETDAIAAKKRLEASGVFVSLIKESGMQQSSQPAVGASLHVRAKDEKRANQILRAMRV